MIDDPLSIAKQISIPGVSDKSHVIPPQRPGEALKRRGDEMTRKWQSKPMHFDRNAKMHENRYDGCGFGASDIQGNFNAHGP